CRESHDACNRLRKHGVLPTRLIDIGTEDSPNPRLVLSRTISDSSKEHAAYMTLSHKWGSAPFLVLSWHNLKEFQEALPMEQVPKTFRDAIYFAHCCGARYLWIDSLCIIQDSTEDWQIEASTMHTVYSNSYLNIAASESENPSEGLRAAKFADLEQPMRFLFQHGAFEGVYSCHYETLSDLEGTNSLSQRGWVLQERLMSPQTIHFTSTVTWECREIFASQLYPEGKEGTLEKIRYSMRIGSVENRHLLWTMAIQNYSRCTLTKTDDKLVAISGIARTLQALHQNDYLAGLWRDNLVEGLMWVPELDNDVFGYGTTCHLAPYWSWASVDGPVSMAFSIWHKNLVFQVLEAKTTPLHGDIFDQVKSEFIKLLGSIYCLGVFDNV
ncbi:HET-domain-containing protein, partial [Polyplosphaeria fusca]